MMQMHVYELIGFLVNIVEDLHIYVFVCSLDTG